MSLLEGRRQYFKRAIHRSKDFKETDKKVYLSSSVGVWKFENLVFMVSLMIFSARAQT